MPLVRLSLLSLFLIAAPSWAQTTHFTSCVSNTGNNATIAILSSAPVLNGVALVSGDEVAVYTPGGICAGAALWTGANIGITVWGDDDQTPAIDGFRAGESYAFRIWDQSANYEIKASPTTAFRTTYSSGDSTYSVNGISVIGDLTVPTLLSLVSTDVRPGRVTLRWYASGSEGQRASVYRRPTVTESEGMGNNWTALAVVDVPGNGVIDYVDSGVEPGHDHETRRANAGDCADGRGNRAGRGRGNAAGR